MMINDVLVELKISGANRIKYQEILNIELKNAEIINVYQHQVLPTSRTKVECKCDICDCKFFRVRKDVKENTLCSLTCRNEYSKRINKFSKKDKLKVNCTICNVEMEVHESQYKKQKGEFRCSRECYKKHRSINYNKSKLYNYQDLSKQCDNSNCNATIKVSEWKLKNNKHIFCTQNCYWEHRKEFYIEHYYVDELFDSKSETKPEKMVREYLESKNIQYISQYKIDSYFADFYLPEYNEVIEVYGDYWHVNPKFYGNGKREIHKNQIGVFEKDKLRVLDIEKKGIKVHIIWECDVYNDLINQMNLILQ